MDFSHEPINGMNITDYVKFIRNKYRSYVDINFMDFFMSLHMDNNSENKFIINSEYLARYNLITIRKDRNYINIADIKRLIESLELIENIDYEVRVQARTQNENIDYELRREQAPQLEKDNITRSKTLHQYWFTPNAFKKCLMCSIKKENIKYKTYYIFLEECIYYYNKQQMINKSTEIERLIQELHEQTIVIKQQTEEIKQQTEEIKTLNKTVEKVLEKMKDRAVPPTAKQLEERFIIMKNKSKDEYYVIRCQLKTVQKSIKIKQNDGYKPLDDIIESITIPNSVYLWNLIKEQLKENRQINTFRNTFMLSNITEEEFIEIIKEIFNQRLLMNN
jgi:hypothetical protein